MAEPGVRRAREQPDAPAGSRSAVLAARVDRVLDASLVVLATWTVVYHLSLLLGIGSNVALAVEAALLTALLVAGSRRAHLALPSPATTVEAPGLGPGWSRIAVRLAAGAGLAAALAMALDLPWALVCVCWLVAAGAGLVAAVVSPPETEPPEAEPPAAATPLLPHVTWPDRLEVPVVLALTAGLAVLSTLVLRANPDDLYYVNLSQWVAEHGTFPVRDTIFGDLVYPMSNWPPLASYDGLTGAVAHLLRVPAGDIVYVVVPPVTTALAVLALWRLLRAWRVQPVVVALGFAVLFLLVDGTSSYGPPGNLFLTRLWQGKVILLCLVVPLLLVHALAYVRQPSRTRAGLARRGRGRRGGLLDHGDLPRAYRRPGGDGPPGAHPRAPGRAGRGGRLCRPGGVPARWVAWRPWRSVAARPTTSANAAVTASTPRGSVMPSSSPTSWPSPA